MNKVPDRKRLRRSYLLQKGMPFIYLAFNLILVLIWVPAWNAMERPLWFLCFIVAIFLLPSIMNISKDLKKAKQVPYVPPVTASTLPAEEILVRAADVPPVAQSTILLRAAQAGQETPKEELLRVSNGDRSYPA
jgi:hypothetical protein